MNPLKFAFTASCLIPLAWLAYRLVTGDLGAQPAEAMNHQLGLIALRLLAINLIWGSLLALGWVRPAWRRYTYLRRHLGVVTFVYALGHLAFYFSKEGDIALATKQMFTKTYLIVGLASLVILTVLSVTSADWAVRKLKKRWKPLHRSVYVALLLTVIHYQLIEKKDWTEALPLLLPTVALFGVRLIRAARPTRRAPVVGR